MSAACKACGSPVRYQGRGRQPRFCCDACKLRAFRSRSARNEKTPKAPTADDPREANFVTKLCSEINGLQGQKTALSLSWIKVNEVTWKLSDGRMSRTPASHGQWAGYESPRAAAWVIEVGWPFGRAAWYARCGEKSFGPTSFAIAKQAAFAFVTGAALPAGARSFIGLVDLNAEPPEPASATLLAA